MTRYDDKGAPCLLGRPHSVLLALPIAIAIIVRTSRRRASPAVLSELLARQSRRRFYCTLGHKLGALWLHT